MTRVVRVCKYGCSTELGRFDEKLGKYLEMDGTPHSKERCQSIKSNLQVPNGHNSDLSLEVVLKKLKTIGITLDLEVLRNAVNGDNKK
jgi:hypothetical protein